MEKLSGSGYDTVLTFQLEKGAVSTFKLLYQHVKNEWKLEALYDPKNVAVMGGMSMGALGGGGGGGYVSGMEQRLAV